MRRIAALRLSSLAGQQQPFSSRVLLNVTYSGQSKSSFSANFVNQWLYLFCDNKEPNEKRDRTAARI
jgi:hypothetical protein